MLSNPPSSLWCHQESNRGHKDFQSFALPTELWHHRNVCNPWRKRRDSNSWYGCPYGSLANCWFQPLTHPSKEGFNRITTHHLKCECKGSILFLFLKIFYCLFLDPPEKRSLPLEVREMPCRLQDCTTPKGFRDVLEEAQTGLCWWC